MKLALISLGCTKNLVDSEAVAGFFVAHGYETIAEVEEADVIVLNTCAFLRSARKEAEDFIKQIESVKKEGAKLVVVGCLPQLMKEQLQKKHPNLGAIVPISDYNNLKEVLSGVLPLPSTIPGLSFLRRAPSDPFHAYVKISEGCNNCCAYCLIPTIRSSFKSRPESEIMEEIEGLLASGIQEITIVSQDTTRYGTDWDGEKRIVPLLKQISSLKGLRALRLLYLYPDDVTDELIEVIATNSVIAPYFDLPLQHGSNKILGLMGRRGDKDSYKALIKKIRKRIPEAVIRTTMIVGFPGEDTQDFVQLRKMVTSVKFDHLGVFVFSSEPGTQAHKMPNPVNKKLAQRRQAKIMALQKEISRQNLKKLIGQHMNAVIIGEEEKYFHCRSYLFAPDDIDGLIFLEREQEIDLPIGTWVKIQIEAAGAYDLVASLVRIYQEDEVVLCRDEVCCI